MAVVTILNEDKTLTSADEIASALANYGIDYERWTPSHPIADDTPPEEILNAYSREIEDLKQRGVLRHPDSTRCSRSLIANTGTTKTK
jgi:cupin superfamily acireductone dioxygenase involved in methionine salvage